MTRSHRRWLVGVALGCLGAALCAGAASAVARNARTAAKDVEGGSATVAIASFESLDPQIGFLTTDSEADWNVYTPLLTFKHANGVAGTELIPGLATGLPKVSRDGKTYTLVLRKGLKYSNGQTAKASDFKFTVQRALKLNWGGNSFLTADIQGASDYLAGKAASVSGITTNDASGKITIKLVQGDSAFSNILAFTGLGLVPSSTPLSDQATHPPAGIGPYVISNVQPNESFTLTKARAFAKLHLPGIPLGHLHQIKAIVVTNPLTAGQQVLNNQADALDPTDVVAPSLIPTISSQAANRFRAEPTEAIQYLFFNTTIAPFNNKNARVAVTYAFDRNAVNRIEGGFLQVGCYVLPVQFPGHPTQACPYGKPAGGPNVDKAKSLIQAAHLDGTSVTVWSQAAAPYDAIGAYYVSVLDAIGFKATLKTISPAIYYPTTANPALKIQTGFAAYHADYADPTTFYHLLDARTITPTFSVNRDQVNDARIQSTLAKLQPLPLSPSVNAQWQALDQYVAKQAYWLILGYPKAPELFSNRIDVKKTIFSQRYLSDWTSWQLVR